MKTADTNAIHFAEFRFGGKLNDFLPPVRRQVLFTYPFKGNPAIKDTIEALGVPHTEIDCIFVNKRSAGFSYQLKPGDKVFVYANCVKKSHASKTKLLRKRSFQKPRFILDAHLGKLARHLRLFGFDALYQKDYADQDIVKAVQRGHRIVLTRDVGLLKNKSIKYGYWVRSTDPQRQIKEIIVQYNLSGKIRPFRLCLKCNGKIVKVGKKKIEHQLPPDTKNYYQKFHRCISCKKIYWEGSHYQKLSSLVDRLSGRYKKTSRRDKKR